MYLDHRITIKIARVLDMVDMSALLLDANGSVILPEGDQRVFTLPEELRQNPTTPFVYGGVTLIGAGDEQPVLSQTTREQALRVILRGEAEGAELESIAAEHDIPMQRLRCVMYFFFQDMEVESAMQVMGNAMTDGEDMMTEVGRHAVAMLKYVGEDDGLAMVEEFARAFESSFLTETGGTVFIGISDPRQSLEEIPTAYREAHNAINVGRVYHSTKHVFTHRSLLLERFLSDVSPEMGMSYNSAIFNRSTARLFNDEMVHTIETFFDNSLNLSETARKLYIHRNTLVYRLEKVQHAIGLDLRNFDDAVTFKMMMLLGKGGSVRKQRQ